MARFHSKFVLLLAFLGLECAAAPRGSVNPNLAYEISVREPSDISSRAVTNQQIAWVSYIWPGDGTTISADWQRVIGFPSKKVTLVIANVDNGPGVEGHPNEAAWKKVVTAASGSGKRIIGYVRTGWFSQSNGAKTRKGTTLLADWVEQIKGDIDLWYKIYPGIGGIFFDEGHNACGANNIFSDTYKSLSDYAKSKKSGALTTLNPGGWIPECYKDSADTLLTFENTYDVYVNHWTPYILPWTPTDPHKIWHVVYGVAEANVAQVHQLTEDRGAGYIALTDDSGDNPYDGVPSNSYMNTLFGLVDGA